MSTAPPAQSVKSRPGPKLNEAQKRAIIARVATGETKSSVARAFGVTRTTVQSLVKTIQEVPESPLRSQDGWQKRLREEMPAMSVDAMSRSISDLEDPHKAAVTAIAHLKGIGVLNPDGASTTINVTLNLIRSLPADVQQEYLVTDIEDGVINVTPEASDPHR